MGWLTEDKLDRFLGAIDAWSKPVAFWVIVLAVIYFGGIIIFG